MLSIRAGAGSRPCSVLRFVHFIGPKRMLNGASSFMPEVGEDPRPIMDAPLSPHQALLGFLELTFGVAHAAAPGSFELWVCGHAESQN